MSPSEAFAFSSSNANSPTTPSVLDPRFAANRSVRFTQETESRAFGFNYVDEATGRQVTEWVFQPQYVPPPAEAATAEVPELPNHEFTSLAEWQAAMAETGPNAIWQPGSTFARSYVNTYRGVPSDSVAFYAPNEVWPVVPVAPAAGDSVDQIDPGQVFSLVPPMATSMTNPGGEVATPLKTAIRVVTAAGAGHPERGDTNAYTAEFWALFSEYEQPTTQPLMLVPGPPPGVPAQSLPEFLKHYYDATGDAAPQSMVVVTCSRSRVNPYQA